jgi:hypothetical protein
LVQARQLAVLQRLAALHPWQALLSLRQAR